jgi:hypothetical protein
MQLFSYIFLKRSEFGRSSVSFPEDVEWLRHALPVAEIVLESYDKALNGNNRYAERLLSHDR